MAVEVTEAILRLDSIVIAVTSSGTIPFVLSISHTVSGKQGYVSYSENEHYFYNIVYL